MNLRILEKEKFIIKYSKKNLTKLIIILVLFMIGVIIGTTYYSIYQDKVEIATYLEELFFRISNINFDDGEVFRNILYNNIKVIVLLWVVGASVLGAPIVAGYIGYMGIIFGYVSSVIISTFGCPKGVLGLLFMLFIEKLLWIIPLMILLNSSVKLIKGILSDNKDWRYVLVKYILVLGISLAVVMITAIIQLIISGYIWKGILAW